MYNTKRYLGKNTPPKEKGPDKNRTTSEKRPWAIRVYKAISALFRGYNNRESERTDLLYPSLHLNLSLNLYISLCTCESAFREVKNLRWKSNNINSSNLVEQLARFRLVRLTLAELGETAELIRA